ncbi:dihydrofolate reductase family protein [Kineococcus glutinatus]|uniref:Dihydrofolate reductase family protein n=1 Tax=Kineococcus glutinatus TaxID=1070872 RepID=A0ABP9HTQ0_9ACTN
MGKLVVVENVSLDGVAQSPGRPDEDTRGGFALGGWASSRLMADPVAAQAAFEGQGRTGALLFGRRTYLDLVGFWLSTPEPNPFTEILRATPKHVVSATLAEPLPHPNSALLRGDLPTAVADLKRDTDGDVVVLGSVRLVHALTAAGLVDEFVLTTLPVVLGSGTRLFDGTHVPLEVVRSTTSPTGTVVATYRTTGAAA